MSKWSTCAVCTLVLLAGLSGGDPSAALPGDVVMVPLKQVGPSPAPGPFPAGWASINIPKGEVTILAIFPAGYEIVGGTDPATNREVHFEAWLVDHAPPHPCPDLPADVVQIPSGEGILDGSEDIENPTGTIHICGSRRSSETGFRHFPGWINRAFQHTYFPVSQGLLKPTRFTLGNLQLFSLRHSTNMGLAPFDLVAVTVEPPGTGAPRRDYDPRPNPRVLLAGRIPLLPKPEPPNPEPPQPGSGPQP